MAASLALEDITPSGQLGIEHVKNILARLNSPPIPDPVSTMLVVKEAPVADTAKQIASGPMSLWPIRRCDMRTDIRESLKSLRLHGMVMAWEELTEHGESTRIESSRGCWNTCFKPKTPIV